MHAALEQRCRSLLTELGLIATDDSLEICRLTGGVASDIVRVRVDGNDICVKFALPKLRVQADWYAPVHRNAAEYAWLEVAADIAPHSAIKLLGRSAHHHGFAMEFLDDNGIYLWKNALLSNAADQGEAGRVGELIGRIQAASTGSDFDTRPFQNSADFMALRIEPYLLHTAACHGEVANELQVLAAQLHESRQVLVHGDVSPKNIFFRHNRAVVLDAECATLGDASFDIAFCLNHLVLKAIHLPGSQVRYWQNIRQLWSSYSPFIIWEAKGSVEARTCRLLPALLLARVDGKSPVDYLKPSERDTARRIALRLIKSPVSCVDELLQCIDALLEDVSP